MKSPFVRRLPRGRRSVNMEQLTPVLEQLTPGIPVKLLKDPTYDGEHDVTQFMQQFRVAAAEKNWAERKALLHLRKNLL